MSTDPDGAQAIAKAALRREVLVRRNRLPESDRKLFSARISKKILALESYREAQTVLAYSSFGAEFATSDFIERVLADGKILGLPRVNRAERRLDLYRVDDPATQLAPGVWGIREPLESCQPAAHAEIDFVLVPGVAFTAQGERLGYGGGFYDRLLARLQPLAARVTAAFSVQICEDVPTDDHDQLVDLIVTEHAVFASRRRTISRG